MINRRKVLQACQATGVDPSVHIQIANTLPAICSSISDGTEYQITEEAIRTAMQRHIDKRQHTDQYATGVQKVLVWLRDAGELPDASTFAPPEPTVRMDDGTERIPATGEVVSEPEAEDDQEAEPEPEAEDDQEAEPEPEPEVEDEPEPAPKARKQRTRRS